MLNHTPITTLLRHSVALPLPDGLSFEELRRSIKALRCNTPGRVATAIVTIRKLRPLLILACVALEDPLSDILDNRRTSASIALELAGLLDHYFPRSLASVVAARRAQQAVLHIPEAARFTLCAAQRLQEDGDIEAAIVMLCDLLRQYPYFGPAMNQRAVCYRKLGDFEAAERDLRQQLEFEPNNTHAMNELGMVLGLQMKDDEAIALFKESIRLGNHASLLELGKLYLRIGQRENAAEVFLVRYKIEFELWSTGFSGEVAPIIGSISGMLEPVLQQLGRYDILRVVSDATGRIRNRLPLDRSQISRQLSKMHVVPKGRVPGLTYNLSLPAARSLRP